MQKSNTLTIGMDLGDRTSHVVVFQGSEEEPCERSTIRTTQEGIRDYFGSKDPSVVAIEVGTHSPWISSLLEELGHTVIIANPREVRLICFSRKKTDWADAEKLARLARSDRKLLHPVKHRGPKAQEAVAVIRSRDALVRTRTSLIAHIRGIVKTVGVRLPRTSSESFHNLMDDLPKERRQALKPLKKVLRTMTATIQQLDRTIDKHVEAFSPEVEALTQVDGVGPLTALAFVTRLEDPHRFRDSRDVGAYLGLCPRIDQSSNRNPELHISKAGDPYVRRLLVLAAHRNLGQFGKDSDLRRWGIRLAADSKNAKKRAVVAVARKLAVLLHRLWITGDSYEPLKQGSREEPGIATLAEYKKVIGITGAKGIAVK